MTTGVAGVAADMAETFTQLGIAMIAAIAIVYFILVVTFGEGLAPFAILFSLPFAVIGSLGWFIRNWPNDFCIGNDGTVNVNWYCCYKRHCTC